LVAPGIEPRTSALAARNSDHYTTEAKGITIRQKHKITLQAQTKQRTKPNKQQRTHDGYNTDAISCGSDTTIRHSTPIAHVTQNNTPRSNETAHKTKQTIKDTLYTMNTMQIQLINITVNTITIYQYNNRWTLAIILPFI
jgi:hypothetical protein